MTSEDHAPPASIEAEQALLGAVLMSNDSYLVAAEHIEAEHFSEPLHVTLWDRIAGMIDGGRKADVVTLNVALGPDGESMIGDITLRQYVVRLATEAPPASSALEYAKTVKGLWQRRKLMMLGAELKYRAQGGVDEGGVDELLDEVDTKLSALRFGTRGPGVIHIDDAIHDAIDMTARAYQGGRELGIESSVPDISSLLGPLMAGDLVTLLAASGNGKGQPLDAPILTPEGFRPMGEMKVGHRITAPDGCLSHVIGVYPLGVRQLYNVKFIDGTSTEVTEDHLWLAWPRTGCRYIKGQRTGGESGAKIYTTQKMMEMFASRKNMRFHIPIIQPVPFIVGARWQLKIPAYAMGALLGDGGFTYGTIRLTTDDEEIANRVAELLNTKLHGPETSQGKRTPTYGIPFETGVRDELERLGLYKKKSADKFIPSIYLHRCVEERWQLLRGLMDTDGWVNVAGDPNFMSKSKQLAADVAWLARSLGAYVTTRTKPTYYKKNGQKVDCGPGYLVRIKLRDGADAFTLQRKRVKCNKPQSVVRTIVAIEPGRVAEAQCIKVSHPSSLYITNDFIVTHNTAIAAQYIMDAVRPPEGSNRAPAPSLMFSQEMLAVQIARRAIAYESGIATWKQRRGAIDVSEFDALVAAAKSFKDLPIYIDQTANQKVSAIVRKTRQMKKMYGISFVVVDHLLELRAENPKQSEFDVIANAALELKTLAKEQDVTVLLLAQCTRESQKRDHWGVRLADLYGGERVRQRSDIMFSVAIPTVWMRDREPAIGTEEYLKWQEKMERWHGIAEVGVLKMRDGEAGGRVQVGFDGARMRFSQREQELPLRLATG